MRAVCTQKRFESGRFTIRVKIRSLFQKRFDWFLSICDLDIHVIYMLYIGPLHPPKHPHPSFTSSGTSSWLLDQQLCSGLSCSYANSVWISLMLPEECVMSSTLNCHHISLQCGSIGLQNPHPSNSWMTAHLKLTSLSHCIACTPQEKPKLRICTSHLL